MSDSQATKNVLKTWTLIAAAVIILRIIFEQAGASSAIASIFGVAWLYFLIPAHLAVTISKSGVAAPYLELLKNLFFFGLYTRLMVMATYIMAYHFQWTSPRFQLANGGVVGAESALKGYLLLPLQGAGIWIIMVCIIGMIIGGITLFISSKKSAGATS